jgi:hypothetical protein
MSYLISITSWLGERFPFLDKKARGMLTFVRYLSAIINGARNPHRAAVATDVVDALLFSRADAKAKAKYRSQEAQVLRLQGMYEKWLMIGGVWSAAAQKVQILFHIQIRAENDGIKGSP